MERKKLINLLLTLSIIISIIPFMPNTARADGTVNLNANGSVIATLTTNSDGTDTITISGKGKIGRDKWIDMVIDFKKGKRKSIQTLDYPVWNSDNTNTILKIENNEIKLPDNSDSLFYSFGGNIELPKDLDTSNVIDMSHMFAGAESANPDVSNWDTSNIIDMASMFAGAESANPDVSNWNTSDVTDMSSIFYQAKSANPNVSNWDTSNVINMVNMFSKTKIANPDVSNWDTSNVINMTRMFSEAEIANPNVSNWDTSNVTSMANMFSYTKVANPNVSNWNVSNVTSMDNMFSHTKAANPSVSNWNVSNVINMVSMFAGAESANPDVSNWNTSSVKYMQDIFAETEVANPNLGNWDVKNVIDMSSMFFRAKAANPDVSKWDVSNVQDMSEMFKYAQALKGLDISNWNTSSLKGNYKLDGNEYNSADLGLETLELDYFIMKRKPGADNPDATKSKENIEEFKAPKFSGDYVVKTFNDKGEVIKTESKKKDEKYSFDDRTHYEARVSSGVETDKLYIKGYKDGSFRPSGNMTRGEVATVFSRLLADKVNFNEVDTKYPDVKSNHWASGAVKYLTDKGIVKGNPDGKFYPDNNITRAEYATIIANMKQLTAKNADYFTDIDNHWGKDNINAAAEAGIVNGYGNKIFKPENAILRSEAVAMTNRAFNRIGDRKFIDANLKEEGKFPDVDISHWAYTDIYEAATTHEFERNNDGSEKWINIIELGRVLGMQ